MNYAGFWERLLANILDSLILSPIVILNMVLFNKSILIPTLLSVLTTLYTVLFIYYKGATPGKMAMGIKVVKTDGSKVNLRNSILRVVFVISQILLYFFLFIVLGQNKKGNLIYSFFNGVLCIDYIFFFFNKQKKTLHDYIADTVVVFK